MIIKSKKAWIRILEAFIAIMLIMSVVIFIISNEREGNNRGEEKTKLLISLLDFISKDDILRSQVLANKTDLINKEVEKVLPVGTDYATRICDYNLTCPNPRGHLKQEVYSEEIVILSNLTYISPIGLKIKIFLWDNFTKV